MAKPLLMDRDESGAVTFLRNPPEIIFSATLVNGAAESIILPQSSKKWKVIFSIQPGTNVFVDVTGATGAIPVGATFASTTSELNPNGYLLDAKTPQQTDTSISLITNNASAEVTVTLYAQRF